ncbi:MAG: type II secretion system F family protein [Thermogutta sp.]
MTKTRLRRFISPNSFTHTDFRRVKCYVIYLPNFPSTLVKGKKYAQIFASLSWRSRSFYDVQEDEDHAIARSAFGNGYMVFSPRISKAALAQLCRRLATQVEAGIEIRTICRREAERANGWSSRRVFGRISRAVNQGESLSDAFESVGDFFPELFRQIVRVGEFSGRLPEAFRLLAQYYEEDLHRRRIFWMLLAWPLFELSLAILVIGFLIWIMGAISDRAGTTIDPLGFGLIGTRGLLIYAIFLGACAAAIVTCVWAIRRGMFWIRPVERFVDALPILGQIRRTLALSRMTWALAIVVRSTLDIRSAVDLALQSANHLIFTSVRPRIWYALQAGNSLYHSFAETGAFPDDWLDALRVGEESGKLDETLDRMSRVYAERAAQAMKMLSVIGAVAVTLLIASVIIFLIFRLALFYIGQIQSALPA